MFLVLIPHCMTEILAKECKSGKSTVLALGTVRAWSGSRAQAASKKTPFDRETDIVKGHVT